jgi:hemolysin-activating ACP:hemolysin acyltransferase
VVKSSKFDSTVGEKYSSDESEAVVVRQTFAHKVGEMVWLASQSELHKRLSIAEIEWLFYPPIILNQYRVFYTKDQPIGLALWAYLTDETSRKLAKSGKLFANEWRQGFDLESAVKGSGSQSALDLHHIPDPDPAADLWLVDLIAPAATSENKLREILFAELINSTFKDQTIHYHQFDPETGKQFVNGQSGGGMT